MSKIVLTVFVKVTEFNWKLSLLSFKTQAFDRDKLELIILFNGKQTNEIVDYLAGFTYKLIEVKGKLDVLDGWNKQLTECKGKYLTFLEEQEVIDSDGYQQLIAVAEQYESDVVVGYRTIVNNATNKKQKQSIFEQERLKKFYYNATLEKTPELLYTVAASGNSIIRKAYIVDNKLALDVDDRLINRKKFYLAAWIQTHKLSYVPKETSCLVEEVSSKELHLDIINEMKNQLLADQLRKYYEMVILQEIHSLLCSSYFINQAYSDQLKLLVYISFCIRDYNYLFAKKLAPEIGGIFDLLKGGYYDDVIQYVTILHQSENMQIQVKEYSQQYNQLKRESSPLLIKVYRMVRKVGELIHVI
ncbi:MAG: glycosyltransferase [Bacillaceae bacterium]